MVDMTGFMHGINLGGWISQCRHTKEHYDSFIVKDDIKKIAGWGLDHVRLPVDYNLVETAEGDYKEDGFVYIQNAIDWCKEYKLNLILDLHKTAGFSFDMGENEAGLFDSEVLQERFYRLWEEFAKRFSKYEDMVCFELLNEVTDQSYCKKWNAIAKKCIERIRAIAPTIKILVGSYWNNAVAAVKDMDPPYDKNIVYNFHCYEPLLFTHQGARWVSPDMNGDFRWPLMAKFGEYKKTTLEKINEGCARNLEPFDSDRVMSPEFFEKLFEEAIECAKERDVTLYCGEYGVIDFADAHETLEWYRMINKVFEKHNIGRAAWTYKWMNFGIANDWVQDVRDEIIKVM